MVCKICLLQRPLGACVCEGAPAARRVSAQVASVQSTDRALRPHSAGLRDLLARQRTARAQLHARYVTVKHSGAVWWTVPERSAVYVCSRLLLMMVNDGTVYFVHVCTYEQDQCNLQTTQNSHSVHPVKHSSNHMVANYIHIVYLAYFLTI